MSSGWVRRPVVAAPVPLGWKLCVNVSPKRSCLTVSVVGEALALALALAELELEVELELELELEHPVVAARPAAMTVTPSRVALRRLEVFTRPLYAISVTHGAPELNAQVNGA